MLKRRLLTGSFASIVILCMLACSAENVRNQGANTEVSTVTEKIEMTEKETESATAVDTEPVTEETKTDPITTETSTEKTEIALNDALLPDLNEYWSFKESTIYDGTFYYQPCYTPFITEKDITLFKEPSEESEQFTYPGGEAFFAKATDAEHWILIENADQSLSGWLPFEYVNYQIGEYEAKGSRFTAPNEHLNHPEYSPSVGAEFNMNVVDAGGKGIVVQGSELPAVEEGTIGVIIWNDRQEMEEYMTSHPLLFNENSELAKKYAEVMASFTAESHGCVAIIYTTMASDEDVYLGLAAPDDPNKKWYLLTAHSLGERNGEKKTYACVTRVHFPENRDMFENASKITMVYWDSEAGKMPECATK